MNINIRADLADQIWRRLELRRRRWQLLNGRLIVDEPEAAIWWLDREIAEMEAGQ
ncbi:hypothetical protein [Paenibacillus donghaensis]|uniref:hypothetical protein n=1 Tax=Paenibacillus donghaensis TaxID=414771 RepID=UPI0012FE5CCE|nr:hypothetical protein [Paenibacillus donghaensis]